MELTHACIKELGDTGEVIGKILNWEEEEAERGRVAYKRWAGLWKSQLFCLRADPATLTLLRQVGIKADFKMITSILVTGGRGLSSYHLSSVLQGLEN
jgi:hypothetical protein